MGLVESAAEYFPEARWQRCTVHFYRNVFSHVPTRKLREVALMLKAIHARRDLKRPGGKPPRLSSGCASYGSARRPSWSKRPCRKPWPITLSQKNMAPD